MTPVGLRKWMVALKMQVLEQFQEHARSWDQHMSQQGRSRLRKAPAKLEFSISQNF